MQAMASSSHLVNKVTVCVSRDSLLREYRRGLRDAQFDQSLESSANSSDGWQGSKPRREGTGVGVKIGRILPSSWNAAHQTSLMLRENSLG